MNDQHLAEVNYPAKRNHLEPWNSVPILRDWRIVSRLFCQLGNCGSVEVPESRDSLLNLFRPLLLPPPSCGGGPFPRRRARCRRILGLNSAARELGLGPALREALRPSRRPRPPEAARAVSCGGGACGDGPIGRVHRTKLSNSRAGQGLKRAAAAWGSGRRFGSRTEQLCAERRQRLPSYLCPWRCRWRAEPLWVPPRAAGGPGGRERGSRRPRGPAGLCPQAAPGPRSGGGGAALGSQTGRGPPVLRRVRRRPGRAVAQRGEGAPLWAARALLPPRPGLGRRASPAERGGDVGVGKLKLL